MMKKTGGLFIGVIKEGLSGDLKDRGANLKSCRFSELELYDRKKKDKH